MSKVVNTVLPASAGFYYKNYSRDMFFDEGHLPKVRGTFVSKLATFAMIEQNCRCPKSVIRSWTKRLIQHRLGLFGCLFLYKC